MWIKHTNKFTGGFTIIETMVALAIFLIVIIVGVGSLSNAYLVNRKSQDMRSIIDSLSFSMDDMSRSIRTGSNYHCLKKGESPSEITVARSCQTNDGAGIVFESSDGDTLNDNDQWAYYVGQDGKLYRSTTSLSGDPVQMTPNEVILDKDSYSFSVIGAEGVDKTDKQQPLVVIRLVGKIVSRAGETPFSLQTAVSQRLIDN